MNIHAPIDGKTSHTPTSIGWAYSEFRPMFTYKDKNGAKRLVLEGSLRYANVIGKKLKFHGYVTKDS